MCERTVSSQFHSSLARCLSSCIVMARWNPITLTMLPSSNEKLFSQTLIEALTSWDGTLSSVLHVSLLSLLPFSLLPFSPHQQRFNIRATLLDSRSARGSLRAHSDAEAHVSIIESGFNCHCQYLSQCRTLQRHLDQLSRVQRRVCHRLTQHILPRPLQQQSLQ